MCNTAQLWCSLRHAHLIPCAHVFPRPQVHLDSRAHPLTLPPLTTAQCSSQCAQKLQRFPRPAWAACFPGLQVMLRYRTSPKALHSLPLSITRPRLALSNLQPLNSALPPRRCTSTSWVPLPKHSNSPHCLLLPMHALLLLPLPRHPPTPA